MNILIVAPHADDEVLGCGGTIKKRTANGDNVYVLILTNAARGIPEIVSEARIKQVRYEALEAHKILGIKETFFADFPAPKLDLVSSSDISCRICEVISRKEIDTLYIPHHGDIHIDHQVVHFASLVAARPVNQKILSVYAYETLSETEWAPSRQDMAFIPTKFETLLDSHLESKLSAMKCFSTQIKDYPNPRSLDIIKALAMFRGSTVLAPFAEAFSVIREIR